MVLGLVRRRSHNSICRRSRNSDMETQAQLAQRITENNMKAGFAKVDVTPRLGVELAGYGPYLHRTAGAVRDRIWARAMAVRAGHNTAIIVSCDLIGIPLAMTRRVRAGLSRASGVPPESIMLHCTHPHSGPAPGSYIGWGEPDPPYLEVLPGKIVRAGAEAVQRLEECTLFHAEVPCEGIGYNRVYDERPEELEEVLSEDWRPASPELTDTTCRVLTARDRGNRLIGFCSYFGCHPVIGSSKSRYIHGDYCGVATNMLEREHPGAVGLFLQGAQGDVNTCAVHWGEQESLRALDVIAARYARQVRAGFEAAEPLPLEGISAVLREIRFSREDWSMDKMREMLAEQKTVLHAPGASDGDRDVRMAMVYAKALRDLIARKASGESLSPLTQVQGIRLGPLSLLACPLEVFQAIKEEVVDEAAAPIPLVMGITNDTLGYAVDRAETPAHEYARRRVPFICGELPFSDIHGELCATLLELDDTLQDN